MNCLCPLPSNLARAEMAASGVLWRQGVPLTYRFLGGHLKDWDAVREAVRRWSAVSGLDIQETQWPANIRIAFDAWGGWWSQLGNGALLVPEPKPTMNLATDFTLATATHEWGHALGWEHGQYALPKEAWDREAVYAAYPTQSRVWVDYQIMDGSGLNTPAHYDKHSIMTIKIPPHWLHPPYRHLVPTEQAMDLSAADKARAASDYPKADDLKVMNWIGLLYRNLLKREASTQERAAWLNEFRKHGPSHVYYSILSSQEGRNFPPEGNDGGFRLMAVTQFYREFLGRELSNEEWVTFYQGSVVSLVETRQNIGCSQEAMKFAAT